jgi:multicomponent Na+:H+ antiporter subunit D
VLALASALTGAAVLRASARIFLGWGIDDPQQHDEAEDASQEESSREEGAEAGTSSGRSPLLVAVPLVLMVGAVVAGLVPGLVPSVERAAAHFRDAASYSDTVLRGLSPHWPPVAQSHVNATAWIYSIASTVAAILGAAIGLRGWRLLPDGLGETLREVHSGHIGDYIAWWTFGAAVLGGLVLWAVTG